MSLQKQIDKARAEIRTDGYPISIGEWISIYEKGELDIHPEFQRFFRWSARQKSRLIESILLGIPIPQVFVAQRADGIWDVVDGLQRLSTLFQFVGILRDEEKNLIPPLVLEGTTYLPGLEGMRWEDDEHPDKSLTNAQRLIIKRAKIDVSIILKESDETTKFELFQRLNTGGSPLSDQEMRNSLLVMLNRDFFKWLKALSEDENFVEVAALSERAVSEQYDLELVLRFLAFRAAPEADLANLGDLGEYLTETAKRLALEKAFDSKGEEEAFRSTFEILANTLSDDSFRRYDVNKQRFLGGFSIAGYEAVGLGVGYNYKKLLANQQVVLDRAKTLWQEGEFVQNSGSGIRASSRIPKILPFARKHFAV